MSDQGKLYQSVWDAIEATPESARHMKTVSALMIELTEHIRERGWTPAQAARETDVPETRIVDLLEGKIDTFSQDMLLSMLDSAGLRAN